MSKLFLVLLILSFTRLLHGFIVSRRWTRSTNRKLVVGGGIPTYEWQDPDMRGLELNPVPVIISHAPAPQREYRKLDEICLSCLPSWYTRDDLIQLLKDKGITPYEEVKVVPYNTSDGQKYGSVKFKTDPMTSFAVDALQDVFIEGESIEVSRMFKTTVVQVSFYGLYWKRTETATSLMQRLPDENVVSVLRNGDKSMDESMILIARSPQHLPRVLHMLFRYNAERIKLFYALKRGLS